MAKFNVCSRCRTRRALTLVEVVAGLSLLASLSVGIILAFSSHQKQITAARKRMEAIRFADELLSTWYSQPESVPRNRLGRLPLSDRAWYWQTRTVSRTSIQRERLEIVRVDIFDRHPRDRAPPSLASVELLMGEELPGQTR